MRNVIYAINLSLDGCCDHTKFNPPDDDEVLEHYTHLLRDFDLLVYGRKTYQLMVPYWPDIAKSQSETKADIEFAQTFVSKKKIVFSRSLASAEDENTRIVRTNLRDEILKLKQEPGKNIMVGGVDIPSQLIELGLVDEYRFVFMPIIAGEGRRLMEGVSLPEKLQLKLVESKPFKSGCVALRYLKQSNRGKEFFEYDNPFDVGIVQVLLGFSSGYRAMMDCDTLFMLGTDFPYQQFYPEKATIIQVDIRGEQIGRRAKVDLGVVGDVKTTLQALLPDLTERQMTKHLSASIQHYQKARAALDDLAVGEIGQKSIHPQYVAKVINELAGKDAIFTCDVGTPTIWAARFQHKPLLIRSGYSASAIFAKSGLRRSVAKSSMPAAFISSSTKASALLLKTISFTGKSSCRSDNRSPMSIASPPSPDKVMTWRSG